LPSYSLFISLSLFLKRQTDRYTMGSSAELPKMQYRFLGRSGLQVSVISLGGWYVVVAFGEEEKLCLTGLQGDIWRPCWRWYVPQVEERKKYEKEKEKDV
jgi:hypothetical protein